MALSVHDREIATLIRQALPETILIRRTIHKNPELSGSEFQTASLVYSRLKDLGLKPHYHLQKTAVSATIRNGRGKTVVLRADTDALPIVEQSGLPFASCKNGVMHACGHDIHTAALFGATSVLINLKDRWRGTVLLLFQPSEEVEPGGAAGLISEGVFPADADAVFGLHVSTDHPSGVIGVKEGADYAGITAFDVVVHGKGGHGGTPEKTIDPIVCTAAIITQLQTLISRETSPFTPAVLTIGSVQAGSARNIIPNQAVMHGTLRCHSNGYMETLVHRVKEQITSIAHSFRAHAEVSFTRSYPPGFNDTKLAQSFMRCFSALAGTKSIVERQFPTMYAEDFSYYQEKIPGLFVHLGVVPKGKKTIVGIHSPQFNPDESSLECGIAAHVAFTLDLLG